MKAGRRGEGQPETKPLSANRSKEQLQAAPATRLCQQNRKRRQTVHTPAYHPSLIWNNKSKHRARGSLSSAADRKKQAMAGQEEPYPHEDSEMRYWHLLHPSPQTSPCCVTGHATEQTLSHPGPLTALRFCFLLFKWCLTRCQVGLKPELKPP